MVADGLLHLLPFDLLRDSKGALLLEARTVSYAPAATVLQVLRNEVKPAVKQRPFFGIGDPAYQDQGHISAKLGAAQLMSRTNVTDTSSLGSAFRPARCYCTSLYESFLR